MNIAETPFTMAGLTWSKSSYSGAEGGECLEVASTDGAVHIRDSKHWTGPVLTVPPGAWADFLGLAANPPR
ncbi:DUF397 domain-containing protein [Streptomyces zingiberis]|uniref:DUF397 domain-containing protein n=1 Tax=Streptomyces zingiberis TaxID=2053010 RepID=A0ABX1BV73_9ACTN|nr:DUF397 domain-containing protein [Streptomyces zingiberis]NJQ00138.1 DUF397 domain-containing protein [Streptomyces zingiberis]